MSTEGNKEQVRRLFEEFWNQKNVAAAAEFVAVDHIDHTPGSPPELPAGLAGFKQFGAQYFTAFPDMVVTVDDQLAEGDLVTSRWTARGINTGSLFGMPATHKPATVTGITIDRLSGGKIVETWTNFDMFGMLQQLGVIPSMG